MPRMATEADIRQIYDCTIDALFGFVVRRCDGDRDLAEDIVQESWLRAVRSWHTDGLPDNPGAWLTTVARNLLSNHFRRPAFEPLDADLLPAVLQSTGAQTEARASLITRALARVSATQAVLLRAFHFDRRPVADIAVEHGLSQRAVEGRLRRARTELRQQIESDPDSEGEIP